MKFKDYRISPDIKKSIAKLGFRRPTDIQYKAIPNILKGEDLLAIAQTGTGKTAAFALPTLSRLKPLGKPQCLVLEPTRELAHQVYEQFAHYGKHTGMKVALLHGGVGYGAQDEQMKAGADIVVATPGRLIDHFYRCLLYTSPSPRDS